MGSRLVGRLVIPGVTQVAEITKSVLGMPRGAIIIDRVLGLGFVAIFARRGLGTTLGANRLGREQEKNSGRYQEHESPP